MGSSKNSPSDALTTAVAACLGRHAADRGQLIVGLSGGLDSSVLLHVLAGLREECDFGLSALHVHHGLSRNADAWEMHCRGLCVALGVPLAIERVAVERDSRDGLEAAARRARHAAFARAPGDWIVLAHHRDDQSETLLFNLLRGTGVRGACAMSEVNGRLLRPLLSVGRDEIAGYAKERGLAWIDDESNADTAYSRNFLRHETLAALEERFPGSGANLAAAARRFGEAQELLDELARIDLGGADDFPLAIAPWSRLPEPRARNALRYLLHRRYIGIPGEERLGEFVRQVRTAAADRHPSVVFGAWRLFRRGGEIHVEPVQGA